MPERTTIEVSGMACDGCEQNVENALSDLAGVRRVEADHEAGTVEVAAEDDVAEDDLAAVVHDAGYEVAG
ncbi:MAG: heavy-metal-associated domain-containing protein [Halolamina sp.]